MPLPAGKVDLGHVRFSLEYDLAMWRVDRPPKAMKQWIEDVAPGRIDTARLCPALLLRRRDRTLPDGCPGFKFVERRRLGLAAIGVHGAWDLNKLERNSRHHYGVFGSCHHRELQGYDPRCAPLVYCSVPTWFKRNFEVSFGFQPTGLETVIYCGSYLRENPLSPLWKLVRAEHAANCVVQLVYRARRHQKIEPYGKKLHRKVFPRLYWLPDNVMSDIRQLGFLICIGGDVAAATQLTALVRENEFIDWANVWADNRDLSVQNSGQSPVFELGDYVRFDERDFESQMPDQMYLQEEIDETGEGTGRALDGRSSRGNCHIATFVIMNISSQIVILPI